MSTNSGIAALLITGGIFLWIWSANEENNLEKLRKEAELARQQEEMYKQYLRNLAITFNVEIIKDLNPLDFTFVIGLLTQEQAFHLINIRTQQENEKRIQEEKISRAIELMRIEENLKKQIRIMEIANRFNLDEIKRLDNNDFNKLVSYLDSDKIIIAMQIRNSYHDEVLSAKKRNSLISEMKRNRIENEYEYEKGYKKGREDAVFNNEHESNSFFWFFHSYEYMKGYDQGYVKASRKENYLFVPIITDSGVSEKIGREFEKVSKKIGKMDEKISKLNEDIKKVPVPVENQSDQLVNQEESEEKSPEEQDEKEKNEYELVEKEMNMFNMFMYG